VEIDVKDLTPERWGDFERLFEAAGGVCGGCWCMFWRLEKGERYEELKGPKAKARMKKLVLAGKALGCLAYFEGEPIGWLSYGPRRDYSRLDRSPSFPVDDADRVWSLPCFFVKAKFRGQGVATALLNHAVLSMKKRGVEIAEAYPVKTGARAPAVFVYTGVIPLFEKAGFTLEQSRPKGKQRMRKVLGR
jgi:GNAT superfamily N-acetyltransferase